MARYFNGKPIELLAPAGNFEIFKEAIHLGCDAAYFGGKNLNMRLHRKDYNFTDAELSEAVKIAHSLGKKAYITVNNMYADQELEQLKAFLLTLQEIKPDALIVQDFSTIYLIHKMGLTLPVHSSVMMNIHNLESIYALEELGVTRVVLSREASLDYSRYLSAKSKIELEYFVHGDMCIVHGGQCLYSGMLFGQSSNRGRCLKPCRWEYTIEQGGKNYQTAFPMAVTDMYMYENIPELINGGITSFKIEGRMRDINYLTMIINTYGDSIDRYILDPLNYDRKKDSEILFENRKRDTSTAYAFGKPGLSNINERFEGTGKLFSSGKVFSTATEEKETTEEKIQKVNQYLKEHKAEFKENLQLNVKVNNMDQAKMCLDLKVDAIYLSGDVLKPDKPFSRKEIEELAGRKGNTKVYLGMPHMTFDTQFEEYSQFMSFGIPIDGLAVTNLGGIHRFKASPLIGDYPMNILNQATAGFFMDRGLKYFTITPEAALSETVSLLNNLGDRAELIVHGSPTVMYMEHDLYDNVNAEKEDLLYLVDGENFKHPVYKDQFGRNHMLLYKDICYLPVIDGLLTAGLKNFRIEAPYLSNGDLKKVITVYQKALKEPEKCRELYQTLKPVRAGWTLGSFTLI
ncbi:MAG: U32 family peptidase [Anaerocolumna sp.]